MLFIGCHLSSAKGFAAMAEDALKINANTFQFFTRNPRGSRAKAIDPKDVATFLSMSREQGMGVFVAHAPYTLNACSKEEHTREFALQTMADDLARMEYLPGNLYNFHPGCHVGQGAQAGIEMIAELLNKILKPEQQTTVLLETMAGKGTEVGGTFEELRQIIDRVELKDKVGVCLDTCHIHDAGYDIVHNLNGVIEGRLKAIHLNDSLNPCGSHKDRHAKIGEGHIGLEALANVINHPKLQGRPVCLETPNDLSGYAHEIALLRGCFHGEA